jgi:hypothetical protein
VKPSEILDTAADIVLRDGWWQGAYYRKPHLVLDAYESLTTEQYL